MRRVSWGRRTQTVPVSGVLQAWGGRGGGVGGGGEGLCLTLVSVRLPWTSDRLRQTDTVTDREVRTRSHPHHVLYISCFCVFSHLKNVDVCAIGTPGAVGPPAELGQLSRRVKIEELQGLESQQHQSETQGLFWNFYLISGRTLNLISDSWCVSRFILKGKQSFSLNEYLGMFLEARFCFGASLVFVWWI